MSITTEAERQERREADRHRAAQAVEALKSSEGWRSWLRARSKFHNYSFANQLLIAMQCPEATYVTGFRKWLELGYCVRRGEKALYIWMPVPPSRKAIAEWEAAGADKDKKPRIRFRMGPVFDRSQVDPLPEPARPAVLEPPISPVEGDDLAWALRPLTAVAADSDYSVYTELLDDNIGGYCNIGRRRICLNANNSVNQRVKTLVHELSHMLMQEIREQEDRPPVTYAEEELIVEAVAFTVTASLGLDTSSYSIPYLASWSERAPLETIEQAAETIDCLARRIEDAVLPHRPDQLPS
ncbi:ArdC-like ssDNA-binding domain-containing protein [Baekduia sp.]|uniref:ArdC-like ssDNA-binding domain-containing protein n=1 Tax=Baekduia sp. TaxID=2600305 RepID=UPI002D7910AC|nr:ArdC-like ssDNA-binding domain-containing protein [Baekduia sp.]